MIQRIIFFVFFATTICCSIGVVNAIVDGEFAQWNRHAFVVKILGRVGPTSKVMNCIGTLVTPSLVLTSPQCVKNYTSNEKLNEFFVIVSQLPKNVTNKPDRILTDAQAYQAILVEVTARWALLKIKSIDVEALCPPDPAPKRVMRLPLNPNFDGDAMIDVRPNALVSSNCYILGFKAMEGKDFIINRELMSVSLERLMAPQDDADSDSSFYTSRIAGNSTACFDDMGAPLICHLSALSEDIQVGMFRSLNFIDDNHPPLTSDKYCSAAIEMQFSVLTGDQELKRTILKHSRAEFVSVYEKCNFIETD